MICAVSRRTYSGREVVKVLTRHGFETTGGGGSHRKLSYKHPETGDVRHVVVPMHDELAPGTLREIADQAGAHDYDAFLDWLDNTL
ncbi:type II toxin-antitoxin system HicA family toxin [Halobacterium salinarum]|uniref:Putative RNA binding protein YcfA, dsRBD-like fold, HicA-like mRNA interferase family n=1 Tax=Halobacterium salinarum (strain ATCC 33171 / DSM 3754 / JCM 8978 / NBRC 102687 / NCIMB 764 / 91-R6) TaxID=2597657 RepID=A0A663A754_HALS9|nr:putative RNA binding protein YcfA, dsRBD-like fold, HicA-like mRNA interferase family [Halobacterium salinarum DSM 3754]